MSSIVQLPRLPSPPAEYHRTHMLQMTQELMLFSRQVQNAFISPVPGGVFRNAGTLTLSAANTASAIPLTSTVVANRTEIGSGSYVSVAEKGWYEYVLLATLQSSAAATVQVYFWLETDAGSLADSTVPVTISGSGTRVPVAAAFYPVLPAGGRARVMWAADGTTVSLAPVSASSFAPAAPSVTLLVRGLAL